MSGDAWNETIVITKSKLNKMTIISGLASYLAGLPDVVNQVHLPQDTGSGYTAYNLYAWDGSANRNLSNPVHTHSGVSSGGDQAQMFYANHMVIDTLALWMCPIAANWGWKQTVDSGCSIADDTSTSPDSIKVTAGTTINTRAYASFDGLPIGYDYPIYYQTLAKFNTTIANMVWNSGVDPENVGDTPSGALKALFEYCSSVNGNFFIATADGTTRTSSDTGEDLPIGFDRPLKFLVTPTVKTDWKVDNTVGIKTTNVPDTGDSSDRVGIIKTGQKTTIGSESKSFNYYGARLIYTVGDTII